MGSDFLYGNKINHLLCGWWELNCTLCQGHFFKYGRKRSRTIYIRFLKNYDYFHILYSVRAMLHRFAKHKKIWYSIVIKNNRSCCLYTTNEKKSKRISENFSKKWTQSWHLLYEKGNSQYFGYKGHIGVDKDSGLVHTVVVTSAKEHDVTVTSQLLHGEEETDNGYSGYLGAEKRADAMIRNKKNRKIRYKINRRPSQSKNNSTRSIAQIKRREHEKSSVRAKIEHVFAIVKGQLRYRKTRYRGFEKQRAKRNMMFALANLILAGRPSRVVA